MPTYPVSSMEIINKINKLRILLPFALSLFLSSNGESHDGFKGGDVISTQVVAQGGIEPPTRGFSAPEGPYAAPVEGLHGFRKYATGNRRLG